MLSQEDRQNIQCFRLGVDMKRYEPELVFNVMDYDAEMQEYPDGDYCKWEDVEKAIKKAYIAGWIKSMDWDTVPYDERIEKDFKDYLKWQESKDDE